jgi:hypothetical protein
MDKETIQQIVAEVVARLPFGDRYWLFLIINIVVMALTAAVAAFAGSYFRTRGQHLATKADFDSLQEQLRATTQMVETIKSEVGQRDWARRERTNLQRIKLEALVEKMLECEEYLNRQLDSAIEGMVPPPERDCISELHALALYLPELENEVDRFTRICRKQITRMEKLGLAIRVNRNVPAAQRVAIDNFDSQSPSNELLDARNALTAAARSLLERIMNVDDGTAQSDERRSEK